MENLSAISLTKIFVVLTFLTVVSFFALLVTANITSRKGIEEISALQKDIREYDAKIIQLEGAIATYSSLVRIENRAKEMGLGLAKKTEYLK